jgi:AraC family transcriptional regulator
MTPNEPCLRALALIERRLFEPITFGDIACESGLSPFHFSRLFTALHGQGVMSYVRQRRLVGAAGRLLTQPRLRLVDLAFDCGFESQQAFTRAFTRLFGVSPGRFRQAGSPLRASGDIAMTPAIDLVLRPGVQHRGPFRAAGLMGRFDGESRGAIPTLWDRFVPLLPAPGQKGWTTYGLCWSGNLNKGFSYMAAVEIDQDAPPPKGLEVKDVPAQAYAAFRLSLDGGELHPQMAAALGEIWGDRLQAAGLKPAGGPDFELYPEHFDPSRKGAYVEFWIPVATD